MHINLHKCLHACMRPCVQESVCVCAHACVGVCACKLVRVPGRVHVRVGGVRVSALLTMLKVGAQQLCREKHKGAATRGRSFKTITR